MFLADLSFGLVMHFVLLHLAIFDFFNFIFLFFIAGNQSATRNFVVSMLLGKSLTTDLDEMQQSIRERYFALTQKPLIACLKDAHNRYMMVTGQK